MRGTWARMAISTTAMSTSSAIPTGEKSPDSFMHYNYMSFYVMEDRSMSAYTVARILFV